MVDSEYYDQGILVKSQKGVPVSYSNGVTNAEKKDLQMVKDNFGGKGLGGLIKQQLSNSSKVNLKSEVVSNGNLLLKPISSFASKRRKVDLIKQAKKIVGNKNFEDIWTENMTEYEKSSVMFSEDISRISSTLKPLMCNIINKNKFNFNIHINNNNGTFDNNKCISRGLTEVELSIKNINKQNFKDNNGRPISSNDKIKK